MSSLGNSETHIPLIYLKVSRWGLKGSNTHSHGFLEGASQTADTQSPRSPSPVPTLHAERETDQPDAQPGAGATEQDWRARISAPSRHLGCFSVRPRCQNRCQKRRIPLGALTFFIHTWDKYKSYLQESDMLLQSVSASFPSKGPGYVRLYSHAVPLLGGCSGGYHRRQTGKGQAWPRANTTLLSKQAALVENSYLLCMLTSQ